MSSASLNDPSTGRLRSRAAERRRRVRRGAVEPVRRRVRPLLDQRHAGAHQARHQRLDRSSPTTSCRVSARASRSSTSSSRGCRSPGPLKRDRLLFGQYLQYRYVRTPVKSLPGEPTLGLDSFDSFTRLDAVLSSRHSLTGGVIYFPRQDHQRDDRRPSGRRRRRRNSRSPASRRAASIASSSPAHAVLEIDAGGAHVRGRPEDARARCRWSTRRRGRAATSSIARNATSAACSWWRR